MSTSPRPVTVSTSGAFQPSCFMESRHSSQALRVPHCHINRAIVFTDLGARLSDGSPVCSVWRERSAALLRPRGGRRSLGTKGLPRFPQDPSWKNCIVFMTNLGPFGGESPSPGSSLKHQSSVHRQKMANMRTASSVSSFKVIIKKEP